MDKIVFTPVGIHGLSGRFLPHSRSTPRLSELGIPMLQMNQNRNINEAITIKDSLQAKRVTLC